MPVVDGAGGSRHRQGFGAALAGDHERCVMPLSISLGLLEAGDHFLGRLNKGMRMLNKSMAGIGDGFSCSVRLSTYS
jgi:hypothetical protein